MKEGRDPKPVLVLDGEWPSALAIVRSLGRKGIPVEVGSSRAQPLAARSRFCDGHFAYPDPLADPSGFQKALLEQLQKRSYSLVIPVTDLTICPLMSMRKSVEMFSLLAMASNESLALTLSKSRTSDLARSLGIPVPKTLVIKDAREMDDIIGRLSFPVVVKPDRSKIWPSDGRGLDLSVTYAFHLKELKEKLQPLIPRCPVVLQEYVQGDGVGMGLLGKGGQIISTFQYRRLHEVPVTGGASSYRVSEPVDSKMMNYVSSLMGALGWDGVAMVEFKRDRETGDVHLMEINGRFWGSLPLAVASGVDFPFYLFQLMVHQQSDFPSVYKVGLRCRQLSREVEWLRAVLIKRKQAPPIVRLPALRSILADTFRLLSPSDRSDTFDFRDMKPVFYDISGIVTRFTEFAWNKYRHARERRRMMKIARHRKYLEEHLRLAKTVLIVCQGNYVRSPFAAQCLSHWVRANTSVSVHSAGFEAAQGRPAHPFAIARAGQLGLDLSSHVAAPLTGKMVERADIIFVMEIKHLLLMNERFPGARNKTFLMDCLRPEGPGEISDPDGKSEAVFESCFERITQAVQPISSILSKENLQVPMLK